MSVLPKYDERSLRFSGASVFLLLTLLACISIPFFQQYQFDPTRLSFDNPAHETTILSQADSTKIASNTYNSLFTYVKDVRHLLHSAQRSGNPSSEAYIDSWKRKDYFFHIVRNSGIGSISNHPLPYLSVILILCFISALFTIKNHYRRSPGSNDDVFHSPLTGGVGGKMKNALIILTILGIVLYGYFFMQENFIWPALTLVVIGVIVFVVQSTSSQSPIARIYKSFTPNAWVGSLHDQRS